MNKNIRKKIYSLCLSLSLSFTTLSNITAVPQYNQYDPIPFHTVMGTNKYYTERTKSAWSFNFSPFYQHTSSANKPEGGKTAAGNMNGHWNMLGLFLNIPASIEPSFGTAYGNAKTAIDGEPTLKDFLNENSIDPTFPGYLGGSYKNIGLVYEKMGFRGQFSFEFSRWLGCNLKGGIADIKHSPRLFELDDNATDILKTNLLNDRARDQFFQAIGMKAKDFRRTDWEDLHASLYYHLPFAFKDKGEVALTLIPRFEIGCWIPLGQERNPNDLFSIQTGNNSHSGLTYDASLIFEFAEKLQLTIGSGVAVFNEKKHTNYRLPTSEYQSGVFPIQTNAIIDPGVTWYFNASMKAENFFSTKDVPNFSCYCDFIYQEHLKDTITLTETTDDVKEKINLEKASRESAWKIQVMQIGITYGITPNVFLGFAGQGTISGSRTYRPTTILGGLTVLF